MELAELVERIQRWKQRTQGGNAGIQPEQDSYSDYSGQAAVVEEEPAEAAAYDSVEPTEGEYAEEEVEEVDDQQVVEEEMEVEADQIVADSGEHYASVDDDQVVDVDAADVEVEATDSDDER